MKYLIDFLQKDNIYKTMLYPYLKCSKEECEILRFLCKEFLKGNDEVICLDIICAVFGVKDSEVLKYLIHFKKLLSLGWIVENSFLKNSNSEILLLEFVNMGISLSSDFLKLVEEGGVNPKLPEISPYSNHLEYLKDQFLIIQMLWNIIPLKKDEKPSPLLNKNLQKLKLLQERIEERLKVSKIVLPLEEIFKEYRLTQEEKILFFAILKEEYLGRENEKGRELNSLINLISNNDYDRIKNRILLDEKSKLVQNGLVDYDEILSGFGGINRTYFIPDNILKKITHNEEKKKKISLEDLLKEQDIFEYLKPKIPLSEVVLNKETRKTLETLLKQVDSKVLHHLKEWGIKEKGRSIDAKIILYGAAGTGKTLTALALAKSLKKPILSFDCSKILSMYVGESEKNVRKIFDTYKEICQQTKLSPILLLDEADQFLSTRTSSVGGGAEKMHNQMQNIFLDKIEHFDGILIATTNLLETIDTAFSRRFNYKIEFKKPNLEERLLLWERLLPKNAPYAKDFSIKHLAEFPLSGGQISLIVKNTAYVVASLEKPQFTTQHFLAEIQRELNSNFDSQREMGFL
ncbi:AAA family ATPase [Helicobacter burdigaliensis]|uniref:AAA family ATPase n=1 Tax=Helicobacter burdigaliensis TaxID=2315334 RepID=UPI000EF713E7|nr:ATP-binding protein [Helicobacter burdigaliensis]